MRNRGVNNTAADTSRGRLTRRDARDGWTDPNEPTADPRGLVVASPDEPTPWEVLRRLDDVAKRLETVAVKLDESQERAARTYVRQDVYLAERQTIEQNISDVRTDVAQVSAKSEQRHEKVQERIDQIQAQQKEAAERRRRDQFQFAALVIAFLGLVTTVVFKIVGGA